MEQLSNPPLNPPIYRGFSACFALGTNYGVA